MRASIPMTAVALAGSIATICGVAAAAPVLAHGGRSSSPKPLLFGIYPGGAAGTVAPGGPVKPEDPSRRLRALKRLRPSRGAFVVRLYAAYAGAHGASAAQQLGHEVGVYTGAGLDVELVLTYRPRSGGAGTDVRQFANFARGAVKSLGSNRRFVSLQITNEANVGGAPNVADGYYAHAQDALVAGLLAAKKEVRRGGFAQLKVGFNWAYVTERSDRDFWAYLGSRGGRPFRDALDWVGFDVYPGTWGPALRGDSLRAGTIRFLDEALAQLRGNLLAAGISPRVALHASESGYPTGPGRTETMQVESLEASIAALEAARPRYNITNFTWFDLRDANSSSDSFENQYGLLRDDYTPKRAFGVYRSLIARLSAR